jgi:GTP-binding protein HflX
LFNKIDSADAMTLAQLRRNYPGALFVSARSGAGIDELHETIEARLPRPDVEIEVLLPYTRGDLLARIHQYGKVLEIRHLEAGTAVTAVVRAGLAAALAPFSATPGDPGRTLALGRPTG